MKKQLLVTSLLLASTSAMAGIGEPAMSNNFAELDYVSQESDESSVKVKSTGFTAKGSFAVMPNVAVIGGIDKTKIGKQEIDGQIIRIGGAFLMGFDGTTPIDVNLHGEVGQATVGEADPVDGMVIGVEGRAKFSDMVEGFADVSMAKFGQESESTTLTTIGGRIGNGSGLQGVISAGFGDTQVLTVGGRFNF